MGLLDRLKAIGSASSDAPDEPKDFGRRQPATMPAYLFGGNDDLEIVGEASYQEALWAMCGGSLGDRVRYEVVAVLVPEPENAYDPNAICVRIDGHRVGYLDRATAVQYGPGLHGLMRRCGGHVALNGVIVDGGYYDDGPGRLGSGSTTTPPTSAWNPPVRAGGPTRPAVLRSPRERCGRGSARRG